MVRSEWRALYDKILKPGETNNRNGYRQQWIKLKRAIDEKCPEFVSKHEAIIFHHNNP